MRKTSLLQNQRLSIIFLLLFLLPIIIQAQDTENTEILFSILPSTKIEITTRSSVRLHLNNEYRGFRYGGEQIILNENEIVDDRFPAAPPGTSYSGQAIVLSNTVRDMRQTSRAVHATVPIQLHIAHNGQYAVSASRQALMVRSIPSFPDRYISPGETWQAYGQVLIDPFLDGTPTLVAVLIEYNFVGFDSYMGERAAIINAQYALRYRQGQDPQGDIQLQTVQGRHMLNIYMNESGTRVLFIRDTLEDHFIYQDGTRLDSSGFHLTFFDSIEQPGANAIRERLAAAHLAEEKDEEDQDAFNTTDDHISNLPEQTIEMRETEIGLQLSLPNLRFVADQARLLPEEQTRLEKLFQALQQALEINPEANFLVTGHTADIGLPEEQQSLSEERAQAIVSEMTRRGLPAAAFMYQGMGGRQAVADNSSESGRALNRRVEVIILD